MAIYHLSTRSVQRSSGKSAVAAAAYRAATQIEDQRTGTVHDYTRKRGVVHAQMIGWAGDRAALWNAAEAAETRCNSRTAREYEIALPVELSADEQIEAAQRFGEWINDRHGVAVDVCVHTDNPENPHAHVLCSTRVLSEDGTALGEKAAIEWANKKRTEHGLELGKDEIKAVREGWATIANDALEAAAVDERIDHRSHAERGIDRVPTIKEGAACRRIEHRSDDPEPITDRRAYNATVTDLAAYRAQREAEQAAAPAAPEPTPEPMPGLGRSGNLAQRIDSTPQPVPEPEPEPEPRIVRNAREGVATVVQSALSRARAQLDTQQLAGATPQGVAALELKEAAANLERRAEDQRIRTERPAVPSMVDAKREARDSHPIQEKRGNTTTRRDAVKAHRKAEDAARDARETANERRDEAREAQGQRRWWWPPSKRRALDAEQRAVAAEREAERIEGKRDAAEKRLSRINRVLDRDDVAQRVRRRGESRVDQARAVAERWDADRENGNTAADLYTDAAQEMRERATLVERGEAPSGALSGDPQTWSEIRAEAVERRQERERERENQRQQRPRRDNGMDM